MAEKCLNNCSDHSDYGRVLSMYGWSVFQRVLNIPPVLNMAGLGIWHKVVNRQEPQRSLNMSE